MKPIRHHLLILFLIQIIMAGCSGSLLVNDTDPTSDPSYIESATDNAATNENGAAYADTAPMAATDEESDVPATNQPAAASTRDDAFFQGGVEDPSLLAPQPQQEPVASEVPPPPQGQTLLDEALGFCDAAQNAWQQGELENALDDLDKAYALILRVEPNVNEELTQQKEDLRFLISKRILEIYASRNIVVTGQYKAIPLEMNRHIESEIKHFTRGEKRYFLAAYKRSGRYRPYIVQKLREAGLPEELSWLPLIESGFKVKALSRARALGLWQFIPSTGYKFGLKRTQYVDERIDPEKATDAAIAYLKELHGIFGDWSTVLAAYNCGEGRVLRVIRTQNVNYLDNFWDLYQRLPLETARYVPRFMAALHLVTHPEKYGLKLPEVDPAREYEILQVNRQVHLKSIAKAIDVPLDTLKTLNSELRYSILPPEKYALKIPSGKGATLLASLDSMPISRPPQRAFVWHRVRRGESLSTIARRYRTSIRRIKRANNMYRSNLIVAGKKLKIPRRGAVIPASNKSARRAPYPKSGIYRVKRGDNLWILAKRYGTTTKEIQNLNNLKNSNLHIGQRLRIPGARKTVAKASKAGGTSYYRVRRGDSPFAIAKRYGMPLARFLSLNNLTTHSKIFPGQQVSVE
ncbi:MAG: LysM peptidoglycan-binding domain-containing protein [Desulfosarcinaceae bacterium]